MSAATIETPVAASLLPAVIEISARGQRQPAAQRVQHWPLTVGRAADADVALTEPCVAAHHLRVGPDDAGVLWVDVLDTINGVRHDGRHYPAGSRFAWNQKSPVSIGPVALEWRSADAPLPPEQRWHQRSAGGWALLAAGVVAMLAITAFQAWLGIAQPGEGLRKLLQAMLSALTVIALWCGGWALLGKLLNGHAWFGRHLGVALAGALTLDVLQQLAHTAAFAFSWPVLARFDELLIAVVLAAVVWAHLRLATRVPPRRLGLAVGVLAVAAVAIPMGFNWQQSQRLNNTLYMSDLYPPSWRVAPAESVDSFVNGAQQLMAPLERRRADRSDEVDGQVDELD